MNQIIIHLPRLPESTKAPWRFSAAMVGVIAGLFSLVVAAILIVELIRDARENPLAAETVRQLQEKLAARPDDEALKQQIRREDLRLRRRFFERRRFVEHGSILLLGGMLVVALAVKTYHKLSEKLPMPRPEQQPPDPWKLQALARWAVGTGIGVVAITLAGVAVGPKAPPSVIPQHSSQRASAEPIASGNTATASEGVPEELILRNWPMFRGPMGLGIARGKGPWPTDWDGKTGRNILWRAEGFLSGNNSPIVWEGRIYFSGATELKREVYCYDARTGDLLWKRLVSQSASPTPDPEILNKGTGFAPSTMATDGKRVFAIFPTGDLACYDFEGNKLWARNLGVPENMYGHASSLVAWKDMLIVQYDQGDEKAGRSAIFALDGATGREVWRARRPVSASWSTPVLAPTSTGMQLVTCAVPFVIAYNPSSGAELWRAKGVIGEVAPSPAFADDVVYVGVERGDLLAIKTDGKGDVSSTHVLWSISEGYLPDVVSPLVVGGLIFLAKDGQITCVDAKDGNTVWEQEIKAHCHASPVLAGDMIYLLDQEGVMHMFKPARQFSQTTAELGERVSATPAFVDGHIFIRAEKSLYCIGSPPKVATGGGDNGRQPS